MHDQESQTTRKFRWAKAFSDDRTAVAKDKPNSGRASRSRRVKRTQSNDSGGIKRTASTDSAGGTRSTGTLSPTPSGSMMDALRRAATNVAGAVTSRPRDTSNQKGTILMEYLLQAADIGHTMGNWKGNFAHTFRIKKGRHSLTI